jgi:hypothetical protein
MTAGGNEPDLSAFQLEVARLFFALPASHGFLLAGGAALLAQHLTTRPPKTSTSSPPPNADMFPPRAMPWRSRPASEAGLYSESMTAIRSAERSSAVLMRESWLTWPLMRRQTFRPPRPRPGRRLRQKNSPGISCSPCSTGPPHETSPTSTFWRSGSARTSCSHGPPRSTQASTPRYSRACSPPSTGSRTMRSQCPKARLQPNSERSTQPGDQSLHDKPDQLIVRGRSPKGVLMARGSAHPQKKQRSSVRK